MPAGTGSCLRLFSSLAKAALGQSGVLQRLNLPHEFEFPPSGSEAPMSRSEWGIRTLSRGSQLLLLALGVLLVVLAGLMYRTILAQRDARSHASHEVESILAIHAMSEALTDAETGERGYLLNGNPMYLEPLEHARGNYARARRTAERLIANSPYRGEAQGLATLDRLVAARVAIIGSNIALVKADRRGDAISPARGILGKRAMDAARAELGRLERTEQAQRRNANADAELSESRMSPLLALTGAAIATLILVAVLLERRHSVLISRAQQAEALREANVQAALVARELNHRVKNLFAVILSIISLTGRNRQADRETMNELRARIHALSIAHAASQGQIGTESAQLADIVQRVLEPYSNGQVNRLEIEGPAVLLPVRTITPLGMIIHELATNAVKYGAFSVPEGSVRITWTCAESATKVKEVTLSWIESGGPALEVVDGAGMTPGFGSRMMDLAAQQLGGTLERHWRPDGAIMQLVFPLKA